VGQKVHPIGFRIGITKQHLSKWYARSSDYANFVKVDNELREKFAEFLNFSTIVDYNFFFNNARSIMMLSAKFLDSYWISVFWHFEIEIR
jgi:hypothetical protein